MYVDVGRYRASFQFEVNASLKIFFVVHLRDEVRPKFTDIQSFVPNGDITTTTTTITAPTATAAAALLL